MSAKYASELSDVRIVLHIGSSSCSKAFYPGQTEESFVPKFVFNAIEVDGTSLTLASGSTV